MLNESRPTLLITSCAGPASTNVIMNLKMLENECPFILGVDMDEYLIRLTKADQNFLVPPAAYKMQPYPAINEIYRASLKFLITKFNVKMVYPQSDVEVFLISKHKDDFPCTVLPDHEVIKLCRDKGALYNFFKRYDIPVPEFKNLTGKNEAELAWKFPNFGAWNPSLWKYPSWMRARIGAGGEKGMNVRGWREVNNLCQLYHNRNVKWQLVQLLGGRDYSWTSLWNDGELVTSVLKERMRWVYNRIGTTAVQRTVHDDKVNAYCEIAVHKIADKLDKKLSGIMMIDLKEDVPNENGKFYITEINAGRLGTVNYNYGLWSFELFGDERVNFPWLLWKLATEKQLPSLPYNKYNALPKGLYYARHIDMGYKMWREDA